jgi:hypothetical protein
LDVDDLGTACMRMCARAIESLATAIYCESATDSKTVLVLLQTSNLEDSSEI